jgi:hypothetical protein
VPWGHNWATLSLEDMNKKTWYSRLGVGRKADEYALKKKKNVLSRNPKKVKTSCNLAEFSKEGYGLKRAVLPVMMMMIP